MNENHRRLLRVLDDLLIVWLRTQIRMRKIYRILLSKMVRTLRTTRVNATRVPPPQQAPLYPVVVEEDPEELYRLAGGNGVIVEDSSEEILVTPTPSPVSHAFAAGASSSAPPVPVAQAPAPRGDDPDNSGDDEGNEDEEEDEEDGNGEDHQEEDN